MERIRELTSFWNWLPAFRAVAETQHLPTASKALNVTAPALSRSIKLLERQVGRKLFDRVGRRIELSHAGEEFLAAVRDGMRFVHAGWMQLREPQPRGPVYILSAGMMTHYVVAVLPRVHRAHPELQVHLTVDAAEKALVGLHRGDLDLAFHSQRLDAPRLTTERLGEASNGVYSGPGHPLHGKRKVAPAKVASYDFVVPPASGGGDGWPPALPRRVGLCVSHMHVGCEVCAHGQMLAVLPDEVAVRHAGGGVLRRLPFPELAPTQLYATYRPDLTASPPVEIVLRAVRAEIAGDRRR